MKTTVRDRRLTNSQRNTFGSCQYLHFLQYVAGVRRTKSASALRVGSMVHDALHVLRVTGSASEMRVALGEMLADAEKDADWIIACALVEEYAEYWGPGDRAALAASEESFMVPLVNPATGAASRTFLLAGKIDALYALSDTEAYLHETKCTALDTEDPGYWERAQIDTQPSLYLRACHYHRTAKGGNPKLAYDPRHVLYDVLRRPLLRPKRVPELDENGLKVVLDRNGNRVFKPGGKPRQMASREEGYVLLSRLETWEEFYQRVRSDIYANRGYYFERRRFTRTVDELRRDEMEMWKFAQLLLHCYRTNTWTRNTSACFGMRTCPFLPLCAQGWEPGDDLPEQFHIVDNVHQELEEET